MNDYIIITPVKNEQANIHKVILSVANQTVLPKLWVIIDGGSTDKTREIIKTFAEVYPWISLRNQTWFSNETTHANVSLAVDEAYTWAKRFCEDILGVHYEYIWTIDGDQIFSQEVCEGVIGFLEFAYNKDIGAASGEVYNSDGTPDIYPEGELSNKRVYRRVAIEDIGGFPVTKYSYDTVILAKLRMAGWRIQSNPVYKLQNLRDDSGIERDQWKSAVQFGKARYYLGYSFLLLVLGCGYLAIHKKFKKSVGVFWGYLGSCINRDEKINDQQILNHFGKERVRELLDAVRIYPRHTAYVAIISGIVVLFILWKFHTW